MPEPIPVTPRVDESAADMSSLVELGLAEPQPIPQPTIDPFQEPEYPGLPDEPA